MVFIVLSATKLTEEEYNLLRCWSFHIPGKKGLVEEVRWVKIIWKHVRIFKSRNCLSCDLRLPQTTKLLMMESMEPNFPLPYQIKLCWSENKWSQTTHGNGMGPIAQRIRACGYKPWCWEVWILKDYSDGGDEA